MKLLEIKQSSPFGIYCVVFEYHSQTGEKRTILLLPEDLIIRKWARKKISSDNERNLIVYGRTAEQLFKYVEAVIGNDSHAPQMKFLTDDKRVIGFTRHRTEMQYFWINHTGKLNNWRAVQNYYGLSDEAIRN